ncbi:MAG: ABC transporter permease [Firmicutes bacterium HGW-Firmicutes-7]|nr:MAG: ABC transporter permease [Firmicutes bacterium HGW-Firmicutes-7]
MLGAQSLDIVEVKKQKIRKFQQIVLDSCLILFGLAMAIYFAFSSPYFLSIKNFMNIMSSVSIVGIIATGMTLIMITKGIDLSVGSTIALAGCVTALFIEVFGLPWWIAMAAALVVGLLIGFINGILITKFRVVPFIATLGMMNVIRGIAFIITNGQAVYTSNSQVSFLGAGKVLNLIPIPGIIMMICFVVIWAISKYTIYGRYVFAIGGNSSASRLAGISVKKITLSLYVITGGFAALAGLVMTGLASTAMPSAGDGYNLDVITAVYLGGNSSEGGEGSVWRTLLGVLIIGLLNNGMALLSIQSYWQTAAKGLLLVVAVIFDVMRRK